MIGEINEPPVGRSPPSSRRSTASRPTRAISTSHASPAFAAGYADVPGFGSCALTLPMLTIDPRRPAASPRSRLADESVALDEAAVDAQQSRPLFR